MTSLEISQKIDAPPELLWHYLATSSGLACWQADTVEGDLASGQFSLRWPQLSARLDLSVAKLTPGKRILLRAGKNEIDLTLSGGELHLKHRGLDEDDDLLGYESSWRTALSLLSVAATQHPNQKRNVQWLFQSAPGTPELAHCYFTDPHALASWLGRTDAPLLTNTPYHITLFGGDTLSGEVLYAQRDVCLSAQEIGNGALTLRTLPSTSDNRVLALGISTWTNLSTGRHMDYLEGAVHRLAKAMQGGQAVQGSQTMRS